MSASGRTVLVGFANALSALEVTASLLRAGHRVIAFARRGTPVPLSRVAAVDLVYVTAPEDDLAACTAEVARAAVGVDISMPLDDAAVHVCDLALAPDALVAGPRADTARFALDKRLQLRAASAAGLSVPAWREVDLEDPVADGISLPAILKPALAINDMDGALRRLSPRIVVNQADLATAGTDWGSSTPAVLQNWVRGTGAGVFGLANGEGIHHLSAHRRVRMMNPVGSGSSACASTPVPSELQPAIEAFLATASWSGMFMIELLRSGSDWWFMELNGRPWGSLALARRIGFEYPAWAVARAFDSRAILPEAPPFRELLCRHLGREVVHLMFVLRGPRGYPGDWPAPLATVRDLLRIDSRTAWYNRAPEVRHAFLYDAWRTIAEATWAKRSR